MSTKKKVRKLNNFVYVLRLIYVFQDYEKTYSLKLLFEAFDDVQEDFVYQTMKLMYYFYSSDFMEFINRSSLDFEF